MFSSSGIIFILSLALYCEDIESSLKVVWVLYFCESYKVPNKCLGLSENLVKFCYLKDCFTTLNVYIQFVLFPCSNMLKH